MFLIPSSNFIFARTKPSEGKRILESNYDKFQEITGCWAKWTQYAIVNVGTTDGFLQIIAYNQHNGLYPHSVLVEWDGYRDIQAI